MDEAVKKNLAKRIAKHIVNSKGHCRKFCFSSDYCKYCPISDHCDILYRFVANKPFSTAIMDGRVTAARYYLEKEN